MKKRFLFFALVAFVGTAFIPERTPACLPVFMSRETLEQSVRYIPGARDMIRTGKIYYRGSCIYVNERYKGVHIINNANPAHPVNEGFVLAPGCIDMAVKGNILYLDNAVDLVSFDLERKEVTKRIRNVFPEPLPPGDFYYYRYFHRPAGYIIVEWKEY
ncbi:MAG: hypothetical protein FWG54_04810 [Bacteroidetes bacterium]|nr:hypothetical protein [Bacteroidota bacterium]